MKARQELLEQVLSIRGARPGMGAFFFVRVARPCGIFVTWRTRYITWMQRLSSQPLGRAWSSMCEARASMPKVISQAPFPSLVLGRGACRGGQDLQAGGPNRGHRNRLGNRGTQTPSPRQPGPRAFRCASKQQTPVALLLAGWHAFRKRRLAASDGRHPHRACAMADTRRAEAISTTCSRRLARTSWWGA